MYFVFGIGGAIVALPFLRLVEIAVLNLLTAHSKIGGKNRKKSIFWKKYVNKFAN